MKKEIHGMAKQLRAPSPKRTILFNPNTYSYQNIIFIKPTNSFKPLSDPPKENWDIPTPPNGTKFNLWPSTLYPVKFDIDTEEDKKRLFTEKSTQFFPVWSKFKIVSISKIDIWKFRKTSYAFFQGKRSDDSDFSFSKANFLKINQADVRTLSISDSMFCTWSLILEMIGK